MRTIIVLSIVSLFPRFAAAQQTLGAVDFRYVDIPELRSFAPAAPAMLPADLGQAAPVVEGVTRPYLLPNADAKRNLLSYPKTAADNKAFVDLWSGILVNAGFTPGKNEFHPDLGMSVLEYSGPGDLVVRGFMAEPRQFKPKDPADLKANMEKVSAAVKAAGLPIIASFTSDMEYFLPTYHLYYVTRLEAKPEKELQVRVLKAEGVDAAILEQAGVTVVQQADDFLTVYVGPEAGMVTRSNDKRESLDLRIKEFQTFIEGQGGRFLTAVVRELPPGSYRKFEADLYFFY